jgi:dienelactone hydrolase
MLHRSFLIVLVVAVHAQAAVQTAGAPDMLPPAGPYAVGLRVVQQYDYSRVLEASVDAFGKAGNVGPGRPIQTLVWYPAKRTNAAPMQVADYFQVSLNGVDFNVPNADMAKQRAGWMSSPQKALFGATTLAVRDAPVVDGKFPVVIYAPGYAGVAHENLDLCEYLASHGYVVIASRSLGARSATMTVDIDGIEAQASDIAFLANYAQTIPQADITNMAAAGYSWGGMANIFAAARTSRFKALLSLDGSIRFNPKIWSAATYVRPARTAVPLLFLSSRTLTAETMERDDKLGPSYINTMKYSDVYVTTAPPMTHRDFTSMALRFSPDAAFGDYQRAEVLQAYRSVVLYSREFLDAYLKSDAKALAFLKESPARHGIGPQVLSMEFHPATFTLAGEGDFLRAFAKADYRNAQAIYTKMSAQAPDFKLNPRDLNTLGYQLLRRNNAQGAVELFKLATFIEPNFANAFDSEGEAHEALGETALAIAAYEKAVAVDKNQVNAISRIKALQSAAPK